MVDVEAFMEALDDYWSFKTEASRGEDSAYTRYVYGTLEWTDRYIERRKEIADALRAALSQS
jgi:hypothetical protein